MKNIHRTCISYLSLSLIISAISILSVPSLTKAADSKPVIKDEAYSAKYVSQSIADPIVIPAGESKTVTVHFKNTGTATWNASGSRYVSAYAVEPRDRDSAFAGPTWTSKNQTAEIDATTKQGGTADLSITLTAPKTTGEYTEEFYLAAENHSWIKGGYFFFKIRVIAAPTGSVDTPKPENTETPSTVAAHRMFLTRKTISATGGTQIKFAVIYQNTGTTTWSHVALNASADDTSLFVDPAWKSKTVIDEQAVAITGGATWKDSFYLRTPPKKGTYTLKLSLVVDGETAESFDIPFTVTADAPASYQLPVLDTHTLIEEGVEIETPRLSEEPRIRVGLYTSSSTVQVFSHDDEYRVLVDGIDVATLGKRKVIRLSYADGVYTAKISKELYTGSESIRLVPKNDPHAVFVLANYTREVSWKGNENFNEYRGAVEFKKGEKSGDIWIINDLLFSDYAKGIGENSAGAPMEYLKAQSVAQVSYAYAIQRSDKYGIFDVVATTGDQLYLGHEIENLMPRFVEAVNAVRGYMVTYNNEVVITPYFANTNGKTKSWQSVWGGSAKPWLVSVNANYDKGKRMLGHGVGMSQLDAAARAQKEGLDWRALLKYYYTGTKVAKMFE